MAEKNLPRKSDKTSAEHPLIAVNLSDPLDYDQASDAMVSLVSRKLDDEERKAFVYVVKRMRHFAEKERAISAALWLTAEEWETIRQYWFGVEALIATADQCDDTYTYSVVTLLRQISETFTTLCCNELDPRAREVKKGEQDSEGGDQ